MEPPVRADSRSYPLSRQPALVSGIVTASAVRLVADTGDGTERRRIAGGEGVLGRFVDEIVRRLLAPGSIVAEAEEIDRAVDVLGRADAKRHPPGVREDVMWLGTAPRDDP